MTAKQFEKEMIKQQILNLQLASIMKKVKDSLK